MTISSSVGSKINTLITGSLRDCKGQCVKKGKFHIYDHNNRFLAYGKTSSEGNFEVELPASMELLPKATLIFRLCTEEKLASNHPAINCDKVLAKNLSFIKERREVEEVARKVELTSSKIDLGDVAMEEPYEEEKVPLSYLFHITTAVIPATFISGIESLRERLDFFGTHDASDIQKAYGVKDVALTSENTWKLLTNGICPIYFKKDSDQLVAEINWDDYNFDKLKSLPNVRVIFEEKSEGQPDIKKIEVRFRETLEPSSEAGDKGDLKVFVPGDDDFNKGLRIANSAFHVYGQTVYHLAIGHVYGARVSQYVHDYLQGTKLGELLIPHCQYIRKISNELGKTAIFGEDGVLNASALSVTGIGQLISNTLAALDPFSFKPREPIGKEHQFANMQQLHYAIVKESVGEYFEKHWEEITRDWKQVHKFFLKLHKSSPTYRPWSGEDLQTASWRDSSEIGGVPHPKAPPRTKYRDSDDGVKAIRHIARNPDKPEEGDRELCEQFFSDFIYHVTGMHSWLHRSQYSEHDLFPHVSDLNFSPITINDYGEGLFGGITEGEANLQHKIIKIFKGFPVDEYALVNADHVYKGLVERVAQAKDKYLACGLDPLTELQVSTVI